MPKSRLLTQLRRIAAETTRDERSAAGAPPLGRREVLGGLAALGAAASLAPRPARAATGARVAVVGAGLAGLTAAYDLMQAGIAATVFEGNTRLGGRCFTIRDVFAQGQIGEHGGEFIDTDHHQIRRLARDLGLTLDDVLAAQPAGSDALYFFDGQPYSVAEAARDYLPVYPIVQRQVRALGNFGYRHANAFARALDGISVAQWVELYVPGGGTSKLGRLINNAISEENAADATTLSGISVPGLFAPDPRAGFDLYYTGSDQRFHVHGGNDQIPTLLGAALAPHIQTGTALVAITQFGDGRVRLSLSRDSVVFDQVFDRVILALPFAVMRVGVDYSRAGFRPLKQQAIQLLGMGNSVKFQLQFTGRPWHAAGCTGEIRLETPGYQTTWDVTRAQPGSDGVLNFWSGGAQGTYAGSIDAARLARENMAAAAKLIPGLAAAWTGRMTRDVWARNPWSLGSYSYQPIGYATTVAGIEPEPEGNCFFAGEHTAVNYGYLNAGVSSGQRAARQVLASL